MTTTSWRGIRAWAEAGESFGYTKARVRPDYRGGISIASRYGRFSDTTIDAIYVSRFDKDFLVYDQSRIGRIPAAPDLLECQSDIRRPARSIGPIS